MTRLKNLPLALGAVVLSAGAALGFAALPSAAGPGLEKASEAAGRAVPARPASVGRPAEAPAVDVVTTPPDVPDAAAHGLAVSTVAKAEDPTPDTNRGADVSAVARNNHGLAVAALHKPSDAGKPADAGKPEGAGQP